MNFIVVCIDTLRYDHLGCNGNDWIQTPNLDRLAEGGPDEIQVIGKTNGDNGQALVIGLSRKDDPLSSLAADLSISVPRNVWLKGQQLADQIAFQAGHIAAKLDPLTHRPRGSASAQVVGTPAAAFRPDEESEQRTADQHT